MASEERSYNTVLGNLRRAGTAVLVLTFVVFARPALVPLVVGCVLVGLGEAIRFWASGYLLKTKELVTAGPYRYTRNPLYLGRLLILSGLCIMTNLPAYGSWIALVVGWAFFFGYYLPRKERVEPARLAALHGEAFTSYFRAVPALFPALRPYPNPSPGSWSAARMRRNREYMMVVGLLLVAGYFLWRVLAG